MKKYLIHLFILLSLLLCPNIMSWGEIITITLNQVPDPKSPEDDDDKLGHRAPSRPIMCSIDSEQGLLTFTKDISEIESYEVWSEDGNIYFASFAEEAAFCEYIFSTPGNYKIRIVAYDNTYIGYIFTD